MVFFSCDGCAEVLKKSQVDGHASRCRKCVSVSCVDCLVSFFGDDFRSHTSCLTEVERYEIRDPSKRKKNAKQTPQEAWMELLSASVREAPAHLRDKMTQISTRDNVPRKEKQFRNFVANSMTISHAEVEQIWSFLKELRAKQQAAKEESKMAQEKKTKEVTKESAKKSEAASQGDDSELQNVSESSNGKVQKGKDWKKSVVKLGKKILKVDGSLGLQVLASRLARQLGTEDDVRAVAAALDQSSKFVVKDQIVSLKPKKRARDSCDENDDDVGKKARKKSKKTPSPTSSTSSSPTDIASRNDSPDNSTYQEVSQWRRQHKIVVQHSRDDNVSGTEQLNRDKTYFPFATFDDPRCVDALHPALLQHCTKAHGFVRPSPIQAQAWPLLTTTNGSNDRNRDVVGIAETGSGKTLAFALPALSALACDSRVSKKFRQPRMLVLSPTRELAQQSHDVLADFGATVGLQSLVVYGGVPKYVQAAALGRGKIDCLVATPGRLQDLLADGTTSLSEVTYLVLDEADRMLDMGFAVAVREIVQQCKPKTAGRQTAMFSATWPSVIQKIAGEYMVDPVRVYVGFEALVGSGSEETGLVDDSLSANKRVTQNVEVLDDVQRPARLRQLLRQVHGNRKNRVLVFALYKKEAERLEQSLQRDGWHCGSIHGNKTQNARTAALREFKDATCPLLIATDVAARGLDIPNVEVVINYTFPLTIEDYVHRIGRTGRAGQTGVSYTFFQPGDKSHAGELQQVMKQAGQEVPDALMKFGSTIKKKEHKLYGNFGPRDGQPMKKATKIVFDHSDDEA